MKVKREKTKYVRYTALLLGFFLLMFSTGIIRAQTAKSEPEGYLGISIADMSHQEKKDSKVSHGIIIRHVEKGSPAEKAGLKTGDIVLTFKGTDIFSSSELIRHVRNTPPETRVKMTVFRNSGKKTLDVITGRARPEKKKDLFHHRWIQHRPYLGVSLHALNPSLAAYFRTPPQKGALVLSVSEKSPASEAGVLAGDVIMEFDGEKVKSPHTVISIIRELKIDQQIKITVWRHGKRKTLQVRLGRNPAPDPTILIKKFPFEKKFREMQFRFDKDGTWHTETDMAKKKQKKNRYIYRNRAESI